MDDYDILDNEGIRRKNMVLFYLIDTSGSMSGSKIGQVNTVMDEVIPELRGIGKSDADVKVAVLQFDSICRWMTPEPESVETFVWKDLQAYGFTSMGAAFKELYSKMSREEFLNAPSLSFAPVIILLSDGEPTDDYRQGLDMLGANSWFKHSMKIAIAIGDDANDGILTEFTGNSELVLHVKGGKDLADILRFVSITSAQIGSRSRGFTGNGAGITPEDADKERTKQMTKAVKATQLGSVDPSTITFDSEFC